MIHFNPNLFFLALVCFVVYLFAKNKYKGKKKSRVGAPQRRKPLPKRGPVERRKYPVTDITSLVLRAYNRTELPVSEIAKIFGVSEVECEKIIRKGGDI